MSYFLWGGQAVMAQKKSSDTTKVKVIDDVVLTGYTSKKSSEIIQSQSTITSKEMAGQSATTTLANMLQGKAPGVMVQTSSGQPGSGGTITIRGFSNFSNTPPLVVIDGMYSSISQYNALNPNDVESQTILKDAAGTAPYGARGASGVILVTTKRGLAGKTSYSFETRIGTSFQISDKELNFNMMDATQKVAWENEIATYNVGNTPYTPTESAELISQNHNWEKDVLRNSAEESYLFSARGGDKKNLFYYSLGYDSNTGIIKYLKGLRRYTGRFNFETSLSDKIRVGLLSSVQYQVTQNQRDRYNAQNPIYFMYAANPYDPIYLEDGSFNPTGAGFPILEALQTNTGENKNLRLNGGVFGEYKFTNYLKFRSTFNTTYAHLITENITQRGSYLDGILGTNGQLGKANNDLFYFMTNQRLDFNKSFGSHRIDAAAFYEYNSENSNQMATTVRGLRTIGLDPSIVSNYTTPFSSTGAKQITTRTSIAALADYNYDKKYFVSGSIRRDGSSRFGANTKYGTFWSTSLGWNIARENFLSDSKFTSIKLRGSYGKSGNDAPLPDYVNQPYASFGLYGLTATTVIPKTTGNQNLEWEKVAITNVGVDFNYASRLRGSFEYFINKRKDFIQLIPQDYQAGSYTVYSNAGDLENKGYEAELSYDLIKNENWGLTLYGNTSSIKNKILKLRDENEKERAIGNYNVLKVGESPYLFKMVRSAGVSADTGDALYYTNRTIANPGETIISTANGNVTNVWNSGDAQIIYDKSPFPKVFGGFGANLSYKNFDLTADFTYKFGGYSANLQALDMLDPAQFSTNKRVDAVNFWRNPGDTNVLPKPNPNGLYMSDYFLQKTDYVRFRSLNVGYTFNKNVFGDSIPLDSFRVYFQAQNLFIWTNYEGDPEVAVGSGEGNTDVPNSYSMYTYPSQKTFTVGLQLNF